MKKTGHPEYMKARVSCSCGESFETRATQPEIKVEICSKCHPFYLGGGRQRMVEGGRVEKFQKKYGEYRPRKPQAEEASVETEASEEAATEAAAE
ncbi:MAG: 50S ribosomal protein L31 [Candidatus Aquicultorales bacterium]